MTALSNQNQLGKPKNKIKYKGPVHGHAETRFYDWQLCCASAELNAEENAAKLGSSHGRWSGTE